MGSITYDTMRRVRKHNALNELHQKLRGMPIPANWEDRPELVVELIEEANAKLADYEVTPIEGQGTFFNGGAR